MPSIAPLLLAAALASAAASTAMAAPKVAVSIKPIHSLVAAVMQGVGEPQLIVEGAASPHSYSLKPSNARLLASADLVFLVGDSLEIYLDKPLQALAGKATVVALADAPGIEKLPLREGGLFEAHDDGDEDGAHGDHGKEDHGDAAHDHERAAYDVHLWLDPRNAKAMAAKIETALAEADPANAGAYRENAARLSASLDSLDRELAETVRPVRGKPFIVFHDAYQYFEHRYGIAAAGSITVSPDIMPGAARIGAISAKLRELGAACVFAEPQFEPKIIDAVRENTSAKSGVLDPEATGLNAGPELYFRMMRAIAASLKACLS